MKRRKEKYKLMVLVLGSCGHHYDKFKTIWEKYAFTFPEIKTYFMYVGTDLKEPKPYDLVFEDLEDGYPVSAERTVKAFEYVDSTYDYDFLLRTNLSTFWNFEMLLENLKSLPKRKCYQGHGPLPHWFDPDERYYLSGVDTIISRDLVTEAVERGLHTNCPEDDAMGKLFFTQLSAPMIKSNIHFMEHWNPTHRNGERSFEELTLDKVTGLPDKKTILSEAWNAEGLNHDHFRIKNQGQNVYREKVDPFIMEVLYNHYYGE